MPNIDKFKVKSLDSHIENLSTCTTKTDDITISKCDSSNSAIIDIKNSGIRYRRKECPSLTNDELSKFCYYDALCKLICPKNIDPINSEIPLQNNDSISDYFKISENFTQISNSFSTTDFIVLILLFFAGFFAYYEYDSKRVKI
jgi:hypothetical protein